MLFCQVAESWLSPYAYSALCRKAQLLRHILAEGRAITVDSVSGFKRGV